MSVIYFGKKVPKGWEERSATHLGKGIWMIRMERKEGGSFKAGTDFGITKTSSRPKKGKSIREGSKGAGKVVQKNFSIARKKIEDLPLEREL